MRLRSITIIVIYWLISPLLAQQVYTLQETGPWSDPGVWLPGGVPGPDDTIIIDDFGLELSTSGAREISKIFFAHTAASIIVDGPGGALMVTDSICWSGGAFRDRTTDGTGTLTIAEGAVAYLADGGLGDNALEEEITCINEGTIIIALDDLHCGDNVILDNRGLIDIISDKGFENGINAAVELYNTGTIRKSAGPGKSRIQSGYDFFNQDGTIEVLSGTLEVDGNATFTDGNYFAAEGATLSLWHGQHTFEGTLSGVPAGIVELSVSDTEVSPNGNVVLDFQGTGLHWRDGSFVGPGTVTIPQGALLKMVSTNQRELEEGVILINEGTIHHIDGGDLSIQSASMLDNRGLFDLQADAQFEGSGEAGTFLNTGTILKSGGTGITTITSGANFENRNGTIDIQSGTLSFNSLSIFSDGIYKVATDAVMRFWNNDYTFEGTLFGEPEGRIEAAVSGSDLIIHDQAVFDFRGTGFFFTDGSISGGGTLIIPENALMTMDGSTTFSLVDTTTLQNEGTILLSGGGDFQLQELSIVDNRGLIDLSSDAELDAGSGGGIYFNQGTLRKSGGSGVSLVRPAIFFDNLAGAVVEANSGEFDFRLATFVNSEGGIMRGESTIEVNNEFVNDGIVAPGNSVGSLVHLGNYQPAASGVLEIELGGRSAGEEHDQLIVAGNVVLDGTLALEMVDGFVPGEGDMFTIITGDEVTGSYANITAPGGLFFAVETTDTTVVLVLDSLGSVGIDDQLGGDERDLIPVQTELHQNYPNPFNPSTTIHFSLAYSSEVAFSIYDVQGRVVRSHVAATRRSGEHTIVWDGKNDAGIDVSSGIYIYRMKAVPTSGTTETFVQTRKMILSR